MKALDIGTFSMRFDFISMKTEIEIVVKSFFLLFLIFYILTNFNGIYCNLQYEN